MYPQRRSPFQYNRPESRKVTGTNPRADPIQISRPDFEMINMNVVQRVITNACKCPHRLNATDLFMFEYRDGGISIEFSKKGCKGQGVLYLDLNGKPKSIDYIVHCENLVHNK